MIEKNFDISFIANLALREKQIQQNFRPIIAVHKWFARRPGTLFRGLLLSEFLEKPVAEAFYQANRLQGVRVADPFMGGGTPLLEANRLGCDVIGFDINPMSYWIVKQEIEHLDLDEYVRRQRIKPPLLGRASRLRRAFALGSVLRRGDDMTSRHGRPPGRRYCVTLLGRSATVMAASSSFRRGKTQFAPSCRVCPRAASTRRSLEETTGPVPLDDYVSRLQARLLGGRVRHHAGHTVGLPQAEPFGEGLGKVLHADTHPTTGYAAGPQQIVDFLGKIAGNGEADALVSGPTMAVLMPTISPFMFTSGPPLLPGIHGRIGLQEILVVTFSILRCDSLALMMPAVTVPARPKGLPMASTGSPTSSARCRPTGGGVKLPGIDLQYGQIRGRVGADNRGMPDGLSIAELNAHTAFGRLADDVRVGENVAGSVDDDSRALGHALHLRFEQAALAKRRGHADGRLDAHDARLDDLGHQAVTSARGGQVGKFLPGHLGPCQFLASSDRKGDLLGKVGDEVDQDQRGEQGDEGAHGRLPGPTVGLIGPGVCPLDIAEALAWHSGVIPAMRRKLPRNGPPSPSGFEGRTRRSILAVDQVFLRPLIHSTGAVKSLQLAAIGRRGAVAPILSKHRRLPSKDAARPE